MRKGLFGLAVLATAFAIDAVPATAQAYPVYPWCGVYRNGGTNCYFSTLWQCQQAISGNGGTCYQNPFFGAYGGGVAPRRARRYRRY